MLPYHLTAQQRAQRCTCGRYLAWQVLGAGTQEARYADPVCCRCWRSPDTCPCVRTEQPAEGCLAIEFSEVAEPDGEDVECEVRRGDSRAGERVSDLAGKPLLPGRAATIVYTDGACSVNPGPGGWAWAVPRGRYASGAAARTTNQRMELTAALEAVRALDGPLEVVSDSTYVINCFRDGWWEGWLQRNWRNAQRKPVANRDLWEPLIGLVQHRDIRFRWVQGHSGDPMNDLVDQLAKRACQIQQGRQGDVPVEG